MSYITFGNKELFEFVDPEKYLQRILSGEKKHTVRFEKPRWKCECGWKGLRPYWHPDSEEEHIWIRGKCYCPQCMKGGKLSFIEETTRFEVGDIFDPYWRVRVPSGSKEWISFGVDNKLSVMDFGELIIEANRPPFYSWNYADRIMVSSHAEPNIEVCWRPAHNLSDIIGKAVITDVWTLSIQYDNLRHIWYFGEGQQIKDSIMHRIRMCDLREDLDSETQMMDGSWERTGFMNKFAKEDGFNRLENFCGYFGKQLKEGESKTGVVYVYEKYKE